MNRAFQFSVVVGFALSSSLLFAQPPGRGGPPGMREGGGPPTEMIIQLFTLADVNRDSSVTKAELTAVLQNQSRGNPFGGGGPPPQAGNFGQANQQAQNQPPQDGGPQGPPPTPGQVLPESVAQSLNLTDRQKRILAALQADVDKRLAAMLTDEQEEQLKNYRPPHGPDHAEAGADEDEEGRPQRPQ
ncbi:EF-hand domain-containing protein [Novipirellula artificiosorum]|uniref:EF-hand domain-containing protein n=1 Tax=Novipirellula artificiosorum TaxID=2528016 RepID=A0A5C6D916_9BACT|nr:EF-hand domain-containing protein [Novipirellula artificiosorum]TWU32197.1 hypothetical protein Poly41_56820 [Novipirellula artificiosorum]